MERRYFIPSGPALEACKAFKKEHAVFSEKVRVFLSNVGSTEYMGSCLPGFPAITCVKFSIDPDEGTPPQGWRRPKGSSYIVPDRRTAEGRKLHKEMMSIIYPVPTALHEVIGMKEEIVFAGGQHFLTGPQVAFNGNKFTVSFPAAVKKGRHMKYLKEITYGEYERRQGGSNGPE